MVQEWLNILPPDSGSVGLSIAIVGSLIGALIWLLGSRFSRSIITLLTVLLGAFIGMNLPHWFGWEISGAGPAVGGALVLGATGYALHGMWVGIGLGTVLASWAVIGCWIAFRNGAQWAWPAFGSQTNITAYMGMVWDALPHDVARILPYACATAMITGLAMAIIWPRFALLLGWSLAGATLLASMGVAAVDFGRPEWLAKIPTENWVQASIFGSLVTLGLLIQWKFGPKTAIKSAKKKPKEGGES